jgi:hypothetical protein
MTQGKPSGRHAVGYLTQIKSSSAGGILRLFVLFCERTSFTFGKYWTGVLLSHVNEEQK